ncbi:hypothetical protein MMC20_003641 [Loxospora ochrophaea]|nr:hypothetical protein [Loxospora ochrophaea]
MTLEPKDADVLVLLDCCYAASSARARSRKRKRTELIAACGYDRKTAGVSPVSFTRNLIDVLEELLANQRYPVPVSTLYKELLVQMKNQYNCRQNRGDPLGLPSTPIHCHLGDSSETSEPIFFAPLVPLVATTIVNAGLTVESDQGSNPSPAVSSTPESSSLASSATSRIPSSSETSSGLSPLPSDSNPTVLLSISFQGEQLCDSNVFAKWIKENPAAVKHIRIEACFRSYSTLLLVSIPIEFWTSLPPDPAYSFVGFLRSSNLRTPLQQAQSAQQHEQQTTSPIYFHHWRPPTSQAGSKDPQIPLLIKSTEAAQKEVDSDLWDLKIAGAQIVPLKVSLPEVKQDLEKSKKLEYRRRTDFTHSVIGALVAKGLLLASQDSASNALSWGTIHPLMSAGAQLAVQDGSARELLNWAASSGHTTSLQILLESGADINAKDLTGHTVLHYATLQDERSAMQILLDKGVIIEAKNNAGRTALHCAASGGEDLTLRLLIIYGANVQAIAHNRGTALHYAAANGSNSTVQLLLDHGADVQAKYDSGFTPLHCAASNGKDSTVQMLLGRGAEIEARDNDGRTALYWAVLNGHVSVVQVLVDRGADSSMADSSGKTAFNIASSRGPTEIIRLLQRTSFTSLMPSYETLYDMSGMSSYETSGTPSHDTSGTTNPRKKRHLDTLRVIE